MAVRLHAVILLSAVSVAACNKSPSGGAPPGGGPPPPEVSVVAVSPQSVPLTYEFSAQVVPYRRVEVRPRVEGIILERAFTEGAVVRNGQLLYRIEAAKYQSAYQAAESRVDAAKQRMDRYGPLLAKHAVAQQDVDVARSELEAALAARTQAKRDYDDTNIRAEMTGRVGRTLLEVGARVSGPGDLLTTIDRLDPVYVSFRPSSQQVLEWSRNAGTRSLAEAGSRLVVQLVLSDSSILPRVGHLDFVAPSLDANTGTQEFRALFSNPDLLLVPGQFVRARLVGFRSNQTLSVPVRSVQTALGRQFVYVVTAGDTARARDIVPGPWAGDKWIVRGGLTAGDRVVVDGIQKVIPGRTVRPVPFVDTAVAPVRK